MPIRQIIKPNDIALELPNAEPRTVRFDDFVLTLLNQPAWAASYDAIRSASEVEGALKQEQFLLAESTWEMLCQSVKNPDPSVGYGLQPWVLRQLLPYFDAILDAKTTS